LYKKEKIYIPTKTIHKFKKNKMIFSKILRKKPNRKLPYMKRGIPGLFLSSNDKFYGARMEKLYKKALLILLSEEFVDPEEENSMLMIAALARRRYKAAVEKKEIYVTTAPSLGKRIDDFELRQFWPFFRFSKNDLKRLKGELLFDEEYILSNRVRMSGEEVFLRGLFELTSGNNQFMIAELVFGGDQPMQSRAFNSFIDHIYSNFLDLVTNNLKWWYDNGWIDRSRDLITAKCAVEGLHFQNPNDQETAVFIDCNCLETSRVLHGPCEEGPGARRWNPDIAVAFYNGWKSMNGLKHQTVDSAFGLVVDLYGPLSLRLNDLTLLAESDINRRFRDLQINRDLTKGFLRIRGDSAYPVFEAICSYIKGVNLTDQQKLENRVYKVVRESIEWSYGTTAALFKYLQNLDKLQTTSAVCSTSYRVDN